MVSKENILKLKNDPTCATLTTVKQNFNHFSEQFVLRDLDALLVGSNNMGHTLQYAPSRRLVQS